MMHQLKAEFRKIWTVRSTYAIILVNLAIAVLLVSFWIYGFKNVGHAEKVPTALLELLYGAVGAIGLFVSFIAILSVGHEYRYNTILYSLTAVNRRTKLFVAKWIATTLSALAIAAVTVLLCIAGFYLGQHVHNINAVTQTLPNMEFVWRCLVSVVVEVSFAFIIAMLIRSQVGAIATFLVVPTTVEQLLYLLLKENTKYLPFTALGNLTATKPSPSVSVSLAVVAVYFVVGGIAAWGLFVRRDAS